MQRRLFLRSGSASAVALALAACGGGGGGGSAASGDATTNATGVTTSSTARKAVSGSFTKEGHG